MTPKELLCKTAKFARNARWGTGHFYQPPETKSGRPTYCAVGMLRRCAGAKAEYDMTPPLGENGMAYFNAMNIIETLLPLKDDGRRIGLLSWNDSVVESKKEIVALFDKACEIADSIQQPEPLDKELVF